MPCCMFDVLRSIVFQLITVGIVGFCAWLRHVRSCSTLCDTLRPQISGCSYYTFLSASSQLIIRFISRPIKKKSGVIAGMPRVGGGRDSPVGYGHMDDTEDVRPRKTSPRNLPTSESLLLGFHSTMYRSFACSLFGIAAPDTYQMASWLIYMCSMRTTITAPLVVVAASFCVAMDARAPFISHASTRPWIPTGHLKGSGFVTSASRERNRSLDGKRPDCSSRSIRF